MTKTDRRVQRTHELLQKALIELLGEREYDAITIQDIADRANVGRTTFYLHYRSKDDLFMGCHEAIVSEFQSRPFHYHPLGREELLSPAAPAEMVLLYQHLEEAWPLLYPVFQGKDGSLILQRIRDEGAREIKANLQAIFAETDSIIPLDILANYLAGAQIALMQWWLEKRRPYAPEDLAQSFHNLQRAAICEAFELRDGK
jgi:AcrR family transcriptional regulator